MSPLEVGVVMLMVAAMMVISWLHGYGSCMHAQVVCERCGSKEHARSHQPFLGAGQKWRCKDADGCEARRRKP